MARQSVTDDCMAADAPFEIAYRAATPEDEPFLLALRKATMDAHMKRVGMRADDDEHRRRVRYRYDDARIVLVDGVSAGLLKTYRTPIEQYVLQLQIAPAHQAKVSPHLMHSV